jgi:endonuclease/exonuclease/phosphatase family metal-dependent hydrolase
MIRYLLVSAVCAILAGAADTPGFAAAIAEREITIATFNIQIFGKSKRSKAGVMSVLADIADEFDIIAIQEIRDRSGETPGAYLAEMNAQGDEDHSMAVSGRLGRTRSKEQYVFYFDTRRVAMVGAPATYPDYGDLFEREPFGVRFRAGELDFVLLNVHIKPDDAPAEIKALGDVHRWAVEVFGDSDVVILGDFNADCRYFAEGTREALLDMNWITPPHFDTTVKDTDCTYDHFVISDSLVDAFIGSVGVFRFDLEYDLTREFSEDVSDHYPVWASFATKTRRGTHTEGENP